MYVSKQCEKLVYNVCISVKRDKTLEYNVCMSVKWDETLVYIVCISKTRWNISV